VRAGPNDAYHSRNAAGPDGYLGNVGSDRTTQLVKTSIQEAPMKTMLAACVLAATIFVPAFAEEAPKKGSDADEAFMTGIRKLGVMSGEAYACSREEDKPQIGKGAIDLATQVSLHFGLQAAFIYSGSFGYGIAHDFDHATCPQAIEDFKALQAKYLGR
jgi:hypothetical protein